MHSTLSPRQHGVLDYATVAVFTVAPMVLGLGAAATITSCALAAAHLLMTLTTAFPLSLARIIPFSFHATIEVVVGVSLIPLAFLAFDGAARMLFAVMGVLILAVWAATDYDGEPASRSGVPSSRARR